MNNNSLALTEDEFAALKCQIKGKNNIETAKELLTSVHSVKFIINNALNKIRNRSADLL